MAKIQVERKTGLAALDAIVQASSNKFGKDFGGTDWGDWEPLATGSAQLDHALYIGGIPRYSVIEILGMTSSNKTSFCLSMLAREQQKRREEGTYDDRVDVILDLERSMTTKFIKGFGIDMDKVLWLRPDTAEEALQISLDYVKSGAIGMILLDSVDAMQNKKQQARQVGETDVGGISKEMNFAARQIAKLCREHKTTYLFINQIKLNPGVMFGSPETTPGGLGLGYYASLRLKFKPRKPNKDAHNAYNMRVVVKKTRCGPDYEDELEIPFFHGRGFATVLDLNETAKGFGIIRHTAGQTKVKWDPDDDDSWEPLMPDIDKGKAAAFEALENNPWLLNKLRELCLYAGGSPNRLPLEDIQAMGPETEMEKLVDESTTED